MLDASYGRRRSFGKMSKVSEHIYVLVTGANRYATPAKQTRLAGANPTQWSGFKHLLPSH